MNDDLNLAELADYLQLDLASVTRMAERDKVPGRRVQGEWRFSRPEIHHWLEERINNSTGPELTRLEAALDRQAKRYNDEHVSLCEMMPLEAILVPLPARTRNAVVSEMVSLASATGWLWDSEKMEAAVRQREEMNSTALDIGVALLHPRRPLPTIIEQPILALGRTSSTIPFGNERGMSTDVFFLICSADDRSHLRTLARLSRLLNRDGFLQGLRDAPDALTAREWIVTHDEKLASV